MTFDEIYNAVEVEYLSAESLCKAMNRTSAEDSLVRMYWTLTDVFTTLVRFHRLPEYRDATERAFNNLQRENKESLIDLCAMLDVSACSQESEMIVDLVEHIKRNHEEKRRRNERRI